MIDIRFYKGNAANRANVYIAANMEDLPDNSFTKEDKNFLKTYFKKTATRTFCRHQLSSVDIIALTSKGKTQSETEENLRRLGNAVKACANGYALEEIYIENANLNEQTLKFVLEGLLLGNYTFKKYFTKNGISQSELKTIFVKKTSEKLVKIIAELKTLCEAVYMGRDLINEPVSELSTPKFAKYVSEIFEKSKVKTEILNKAKIQALKMGGLLGVNRGSKDDPAFCIMEYKPANAKNKKPIVLVGKGITYDTGGMNLKPGASMADMKSDMSGGAAVVGAVYAIAKAEFPVYVIGLVPVTDNRIGDNAYVPGDILTMANGKTVEIKNTDAEGRLILADALAYAQKYDPELVIDIATLTGAAHVAIGSNAIVGMQSKAKKYFSNLQRVGESTFERIVEFPFWDEYAEQLKSNVADLSNVGGRCAGAITAGKFLEQFTDYPYIHLDIAGPAFLDKAKNYLPKGGTGVGIRLFYEFVKNM